MAVYEIPLTPEAQTMYITLAGKSYKFSFLWNDNSLTWNLDIFDANDVKIVTGLALVADTDLLQPYPDLNFGGELIANTDGLPGVKPTYENLGLTSHLYFITP